ncbi:GlxA family transcriptional regulator [Kutzneria chonburiensis]|uniref:GlxA family transcriptional regulator n=1 Tax=Kutzneria chonburiensis TaxID=1483604 RepID=A0ABV6MRE3_9PSEU|nr:helix-turn-helix domain-containing protein [Kutzneria chonburiensis]
MKIAVLVCDGVFDLGLAAVLDVFDTANAMADEPRWTVTKVGFAPRVRTSAGSLVDCAPAAQAESADLLVVPAVNEREPKGMVEFVSGDRSRRARELIVRTRARGAAVASACSGTFLLAEAGVVDDVRVTTTWWLTPVFRTRYPHVRLDQDRMVVQEDGITTAGAAFGHVDMAMALVREGSPAVADLVARYLAIDERPSQAPYVLPSVLAQHDPTVAAFERWVRDHLAGPISVPAVARRLGVSERTLQRAVQRTMGTSPIRLVQDLRIERATELLRTTDLSVETIARRVGYEQANTLRVLLRERTGKTTTALRAG